MFEPIERIAIERTFSLDVVGESRGDCSGLRTISTVATPFVRACGLLTRTRTESDITPKDSRHSCTHEDTLVARASRV